MMAHLARDAHLPQNRPLAVANFGSDDVNVLLNRGDGTFAAPVDHAAGGGPVALAAADLDGNGKTDLAVVDYEGNTVSVVFDTCLP